MKEVIVSAQRAVQLPVVAITVECIYGTKVGNTSKKRSCTSLQTLLAIPIHPAVITRSPAEEGADLASRRKHNLICHLCDDV